MQENNLKIGFKEVISAGGQPNEVQLYAFLINLYKDKTQILRRGWTVSSLKCL